MRVEHGSYYGLGMAALLAVLLEHERCYGLGMAALVTVCSWNMGVVVVWLGCFSDSMRLEHGRYRGLGMDALVTVCSWNMKGNYRLAWML